MKKNDLKKLLQIYLYPMALTIVVLVSFLFPANPISLIVRILGIIVLPGFFISRLLLLPNSSSLTYKLIYPLTLGLTYNFLICLFAILAGINISLLVLLYIIVFVLLVLLAIARDLLNKNKNGYEVDSKKIFDSSDIIFLVPAALTVLIMVVVQAKGGNFQGDPTYHLAIMRKAIENGPLGVDALSFVKNQPHPAYAIMIWPVFLAFLAKINHLNIFALWSQIPTTLIILAALVWTALFYKVTEQKVIAATSAVIFLTLLFYPDGYLYTRLAVPDTFCYLVLMPLNIYLSLDYLLAEKMSWPKLVLVSLLLLSMSFIHLTQYVYFLIIIGSFIVAYLILRFKQDGLTVLKRGALLVAGSFVLILPFFAWLQITTNILGRNLAYYGSTTVKIKYMDSFEKFKTFTKYAYLFLPFTLLFLRKNPKIVLLLVVMLIAQIIYHITFLRELMFNIFSFVFMDRLYANITWYFAVLGLTVGLFFIGVSLLIRKVTRNKFWAIATNSAFAIIFAIVLWGQSKFGWLNTGFKMIASRNTDRFLDSNYILLIFLVSFITAVLLTVRHFLLKRQNLKLEIDYFAAFWLTLFLAAWLVFPVYPTINKAYDKVKKGRLIRPVEDATRKAVEPENYGGEDMLNFIKANLPKRAVFESNSAYRDLPMMADVYMTTWPDYSNPDKEFSKLYEGNVSEADKLKCIQFGNMDYLLSTVNKKNFFKPDDRYFIKVYGNQDSAIYKINKEAIKALNLDLTEPPLCRAPEFIIKYEE